MSKKNQSGAPIPLMQVGRLAFREEGTNWCAYYALQGTMEGAIPLGSIRIGAVRGSVERRDQFVALMRGVIDDFLRDETGETPVWNELQVAPDHEKAGHG